MFTNNKIIHIGIVAILLTGCSAHYEKRVSTIENAQGQWEHVGLPVYMRLVINETGTGSLVTIYDETDYSVQYIKDFIPQGDYFELVLIEKGEEKQTILNGSVMADSIILFYGKKPSDKIVLIREKVVNKYRKLSDKYIEK